MNYTLIVSVGLFLIVIVVAQGMRRVRENHRVAIFRLGRFYRIVGPGLFYLFPHIDVMKDVDLNEKILDWPHLSKEQLQEKVKAIALNGNRPIQ